MFSILNASEKRIYPLLIMPCITVEDLDFYHILFKGGKVEIFHFESSLTFFPNWLKNYGSFRN